MAGLSEAELVARSGVAAGRVRRFVELGILRLSSDGFHPPDIPLARMFDAIQSVAELAQPFTAESAKAIQLLYARHLEQYTIEDVVQNLELTLERAGIARRRQPQPPAIAFLDLTGYTGHTEREGDESAAR